jgi:hypothetical protein
MADTQFNMKVPLCNICKNQIKHKFNNAHPDRPIMTCSVKGTIPAALELAETYVCSQFALDKDKYDIYKGLFPDDFNPSGVK